MAKDTSITLRIGAELKDQLTRHAEAQGRSTSTLIAAILAGWVITMPDPVSGAELAENRQRCGRPRSPGTRAKALEGATYLLPWLNPLLAGRTEITVAELLPADHQPGFPAAIANALHGLGWTEIARGTWRLQ